MKQDQFFIMTMSNLLSNKYSSEYTCISVLVPTQSGYTYRIYTILYPYQYKLHDKHKVPNGPFSHSWSQLLEDFQLLMCCECQLVCPCGPLMTFPLPQAIDPPLMIYRFLCIHVAIYMYMYMYYYVTTCQFCWPLTFCNASERSNFTGCTLFTAFYVVYLPISSKMHKSFQFLAIVCDLTTVV